MCLSSVELLILGLRLNVIDVHWTILGMRDTFYMLEPIYMRTKVSSGPGMEGDPRRKQFFTYGDSPREP